MDDIELDEILDSWKTPPVPPSLRAGLRAGFPQARGRGPVRWLAILALAAALAAVPISPNEDMAGLSDEFRWDPQTYVVRIRMIHSQSAREQWDIATSRSTGARKMEGRLTGSVYMFSETKQAHCGYTWSARPDDTGKYTFTVLPLDPAVLREPGAIVPVPHLPAPRVIGPGSAFDVDLYVSGNERIYDHYELSSKSLPLPMLPPPPAQAQASIALTDPKLYVDGQMAAGSGGVSTIMGPVISVAVPRLGYFALALDPGSNARFLKAGTIEGNVVEFESGGHRFRIECTGPIAPGAGQPVFAMAKPDATVHGVSVAASGVPNR